MCKIGKIVKHMHIHLQMRVLDITDSIAKHMAIPACSDSPDLQHPALQVTSSGSGLAAMELVACCLGLPAAPSAMQDERSWCSVVLPFAQSHVDEGILRLIEQVGQSRLASTMLMWQRTTEVVKEGSDRSFGCLAAIDPTMLNLKCSNHGMVQQMPKFVRHTLLRNVQECRNHDEILVA